MYTQKYSKYRAKRTEYNGIKYDSKFEAGVAQELDIRLAAGEIKDWERQFKVECIPYNKYGDPLPRLKVTHKIDFRIHHHDGSYELLEAKGCETTDWRRRVKWLEDVWLPEHPDHIYTVVKDSGRGRISWK
ncbi:MAG: hypothetical protein CL946_04770 [Ectothiorhodospiraceae bacterium]|nr:hypothetical protein [Ectothiorhodospiraceae bacterium]